MAVSYLSVPILQEIRAIAVQHARPPRRSERRNAHAGFDPVAGCLDADDSYTRSSRKGKKKSNSVRAAADACDKRIGGRPSARICSRASVPMTD